MGSGHEVPVADHLECALVPSQERHPDLLLMDMVPPPMNGIEAAPRSSRLAFSHHVHWHQLHPWTVWFVILVLVAIIDLVVPGSLF